ncbi:hypothetical protein [Streptomyces achromogenes]|uniref:hypothetical protein n=1 Tax=Streptomyces achromogenes TaxID=67255 RepID=UPI0037186749
MAWLVAGGGAAVQAVDAYSDDQLLKLIANAKRAGWDVEGDEIEAKIRAAVDECTAYPDLEVVRLTNEIRNTADLMAAFGEQEGYLPYRDLRFCFPHHTRDGAAISPSHPGRRLGTAQQAQGKWPERRNLDGRVPDPGWPDTRLHPQRAVAGRGA